MRTLGLQEKDNYFWVYDREGALITRLSNPAINDVISDRYMDNHEDTDGLAQYLSDEQVISKDDRILPYEQARALWDVQNTPVKMHFYILAQSDAAFCEQDDGEITESSLAMEVGRICTNLSERLEHGALNSYLPGGKNAEGRITMYDSNGNSAGQCWFSRDEARPENGDFGSDPTLLTVTMSLPLYLDAETDSNAEGFTTLEDSLAEVIENLGCMSADFDSQIVCEGISRTGWGSYNYSGLQPYENNPSDGFAP